MTIPNTPEAYLIERLQGGCDFGRRVLFIMGEIDDITSYRVIAALQILNETEGDIKVIMNSPGGSESAGYAIYDALQISKSRVTIDGYGSISSIAAAIFQAGDVRRLSPNVEFMIHNGSIGAGDADGVVRQDTILDMAEQISKNNKRYHTILMNASYLSLDEVQGACKDETFFTAEEAVECGLADEVIKPAKRKKRKKG